MTQLASKPPRTRRKRGVDSRIATARDVAAAAGVSTASVSRALNTPDSVAPELRDRVVAAVSKLGYVRNGAGRALASLRTGVVGVVVPGLADGVHDRILAALEEGLRLSGYVLAVAVAGPAEAAGQARKLVSLGVEGLMSVGIPDASEIHALADGRRIPCIEIAGDDDALDVGCVGLDLTRGAVTVARYLHGLGHRRFALLASASSAPLLQEGRRSALQRALGGLPGASLIEAVVAPPIFEMAAEAAARLMRQSLPPTAIVCTDDIAATGAVRGSEDAGATVPGDVSVVGFGEVEWSRLNRPALTTLRLPLADAGRVAAARMLARLSGQPIDVTTLLARLIVRGSSGPPGR